MQGLYADDRGCVMVVVEVSADEYTVYGSFKEIGNDGWIAPCTLSPGGKVTLDAPALGPATTGHLEHGGVRWEEGAVWKPLYMSTTQLALFSRRTRVSLTYAVFSMVRWTTYWIWARMAGR